MSHQINIELNFILNGCHSLFILQNHHCIKLKLKKNKIKKWINKKEENKQALINIKHSIVQKIRKIKKKSHTQQYTPGSKKKETEEKI